MYHVWSVKESQQSCSVVSRSEARFGGGETHNGSNGQDLNSQWVKWSRSQLTMGQMVKISTHNKSNGQDLMYLLQNPTLM